MEKFYHTYRGYEARFERDEDTDSYYGEVVRFNGTTFTDVITAEATTKEDAIAEMERSIEDYLQFCGLRESA